jgi:hypothetical protein
MVTSRQKPSARIKDEPLMKFKLLILFALSLSLYPLSEWRQHAASASLRTSLMTAVKTDNTDAVRMLLQKGADPNSRTSASGWSALHYAVRNGNVEIMQELLNAGADPNYAGTMEGQTSQVVSERPLVIAQAAQDLASQVPPSNMEATLQQGGVNDPALLKSMRDPGAADRYQKVVDVLAKVTREN